MQLLAHVLVLQIINVGAFNYEKSDMLVYLDIPVVDRSICESALLALCFASCISLKKIQLALCTPAVRNQISRTTLR